MMFLPLASHDRVSRYLRAGPTVRSGVLLALIAVATVAQAVAEQEGGLVASHWWGNLGPTLGMLLFLGACLHTARRLNGRLRHAWALLACGAAFFLIGQLGWDAQILHGAPALPPSLYDVGALGAIPCFISGFLLTAQGNRLTRLLAGLDLAVLSCALGILFATILWTNLQRSPLGPPGQITVLLYPICYGTLGGALLLIPMRQAWGKVSFGFLLVGLLSQIIPVTAAAPSFLAHGYSDNLFMDVLGTVSVLMVTASALTFEAVQPSESETQVMGPTAWASIVLSVAAIAVGLWNLHASTLRPSSVLGLGSLILGMVTLTAIRLGLTLRDSRRLVRTARETAETLRASEERYRRLVETSPDGIAVIDLEGRIATANQRIASMLGLQSPDELIGMRAWGIVAAEEQVAAIERGSSVVTAPQQSTVERTLLRQDGSTFTAEITLSVLGGPDGAPDSVMAIARDITERKRAEEVVTHQALHDALTDLPNRTLLHQRLDEALATIPSAALLLMDLDGFKEINDTFGHHYGDMLLELVGPRLMEVVRPTDTVARLGGDEFAILLSGVDASEARAIARRMLDCFDRPFLLEQQPVLVGASIGIALFPQHGDDAHGLLRRADVAMYTAKRAGRQAALYDPEDDQYSPQRLMLLGELREAIECEQLTLHYQPQLDLRSGCVRHVEALVRWQHPGRGMIPPDRFISLAEHSGLIVPLTRYVLGEAIRQCARWHADGLKVSVAVNLSARNLHDPELVPTVDEFLSRWQLAPRFLHIEVTESTIMMDSEQARQILAELHARGITIAIDDFGTGYSSLAYLRRLPVDQVKIDKAFICDMATQEEDVFVVQTILTLGKNLGLDVVAEGVENQRTLELLQHMDCDLAQGYFLSRPLPAADLVRWFSGIQTEPRHPVLSVVRGASEASGHSAS